jgi:hypothetical protein
VDRAIHPTDTEYHQNPKAYMRAMFEEAIRTIPIKLTQENGKYHTMQIAYSVSKNKLSFHMAFTSIIVKKSIDIKAFVSKWEKDALADKDPNSKKYLFYNKKTDDTKQQFVVDNAVYTDLRSFRLLHSTKLKPHGTTSLPQIPFLKCSDRLRDHMVVVYGPVDESKVMDMTPFTQTPTPNIRAMVAEAIRETAAITDVPFTLKQDNIPKNININSIHTICSIPKDTLDNVESFLSTSPEIQKFLGVDTPITFQYSHPVHNESKYSFDIAKSTNHICPYSNPHRVHSHNRSYFLYDHNKCTVTYRCYNAQCQSVPHVSFVLNNHMDEITTTYKRLSQTSLHCKDKLIKWSEVYDSPDMHPYPTDATIMAIRGNMGTGKTKALVNDYITNIPTEKTCLFITYQRILANKFAAMLASHGFVNYLDSVDEDGHNKPIPNGRVIVCLDSITRVLTNQFDYVFVDEATSVLLHFNSPLMRARQRVANEFTKHLTRAGKIMFLDACVDNTIVYNVLNYVVTLRGMCTVRSSNNNNKSTLRGSRNLQTNIRNSYRTSPMETIHWIKNTHVRDTNRQATIYYNSSMSTSQEHRKACIAKVVSLLSEDKKIVVASSCKSFTEQLATSISESIKGKKVIIYNSKTDIKITTAHSLDPHSVWTTFDAVIYSPTIAAGLSFELSYFDQLVAYVSNCTKTPTVDLTIQQLFRVRQLKEGDMHIYANSTLGAAITYEHYPILEEDIEELLQKEDAKISSYAPIIDDVIAEYGLDADNNDTIVYRTDCMAYHLLIGILLNRHKSLNHYVGILKKTLVEDYNIPTTIETFISTKDPAMKRTSGPPADADITNIPFEPSLVPSWDLAQILAEKRENAKTAVRNNKSIPAECILTDRESAQLRIYHVASDLYKVPLYKVDQEFYDGFIKGQDHKSITAASKTFHEVKRTIDLFSMNKDRMQEVYTKEIEALKENGNHHIDIYNSQLIKGYEKQLEGQKVFNQVTGGSNATLNIATYKALRQLDRKGMYTMDSTTADANLKKYLVSLTDVEYKRIVDTFEITRSYKDRGDVSEWNNRRCTFFIKSVLNTAYGMEYGAETKAKNDTVTKRVFTCNRMIVLKNKYNSRLVCDYECAF